MKKIGTIILFILAGTLSVLSVWGLLAPKEMTVERQLLIDSAPDSVLKQIVLFRHWEKWSPWIEKDPSIQLDYFGTVGQVGSGYRWVGSNKDSGKGSMTCTKLVGDTVMTYCVAMTEPWACESGGWFKVRAVGDQTVVFWHMQQPSPFPKNILMMMMGFEEMMAADFDKGLGNIKTIVTRK